jgi:hypothetical protein
MHVTPYLIIDGAGPPTDPMMPVQSAKVRDPFGHIWLITRSGGASA